MQIAQLGDIKVHFTDTGPKDGPAVVFVGALGTDLRIWDALLPLLPPGLRLVRQDLRGHGLTDAPPAPYRMGQLVGDTERLLDHLQIRDAVLVGISIGGMVAQGLATKRLDQIRALVLSGTAPRIGTAAQWEERIRQVAAGGMESLAQATLERWFPAAFRALPELGLWRNMLVRQSPEGHAGCCAAISGTDFYTTTAALELPTLVIAGTEDRATPPDLVRETAGLIRDADYRLLRGAGHLPPVDSPAPLAALLAGFLERIGHL